VNEDQGKTYAAFIEAQLKAENELRASVTSRANSALTGATGLVTLVLAVFAVFLGKDFTLKGYAKLYLILAVVALLVSAVCALIAALPLKQKYTNDRTLQAFIDAPRWRDDEIDARNLTAVCNLTVLASLRVGTSRKVRWLIAAGVFQIAAILMLVLCTVTTITTMHS
jgi:MFS family permease